jgi:hypothetical protein
VQRPAIAFEVAFGVDIASRPQSALLARQKAADDAPEWLVGSARARASARSTAGSWPSRTLASRLRAVWRAFATSRIFVVPIVMRRCRSPSAYCTMKVREPLALNRSPNPGTSSSKATKSLLPRGSASRSMLAWVNFIFAPSVSRRVPPVCRVVTAGNTMGRLFVHIHALGRQRVQRKLCRFEGLF